MFGKLKREPILWIAKALNGRGNWAIKRVSSYFGGKLGVWA